MALKRNKSKKYYGIDVVKLLMAICVIALHTHPLEGINNIIVSSIYSAIVRQAVTFFFITSGFLLFFKFDKDLYAEQNVAKLKKFFIKFLKLYIFWHLIYLPITVYGFVAKDYSVLKSIAVFFRNIFFVGEQWFSWPLWYMLSTIYAVIFLIVMIKYKVKEKKIYLLAGIIYIGAIIFTEIVNCKETFSGVLNIIVSIATNVFSNGRVFTGIGIFTIGMIFGRYNDKFIVYNKNILIIVWILLTCILAIIQLTEIIIIPDILNILCSCVLFLYVKSFYKIVEEDKYDIYRKTSTVYYFTHMIWYFIGSLIIFGFDVEERYGFIPFLWTMILSTITAIIINRFKENNFIKTIF